MRKWILRMKKVDIESVLSEKGSNFSVKTTVHIHRLFESLALMRCLEEVQLWNFSSWKAQVLQTFSNLVQADIIEPVSGHGKGKI